MTPRLTTSSFESAVRELTAADADLGAVVERHGDPPMWPREPGFPTLILLILEQQVSLASARATFDRLCRETGELTPARFLDLGVATLRRLGFSRQKTRYGRALAEALAKGELNLDGLATMEDDEVRARLTRITGVGPWTADIYLMMALRRPDIWPDRDLALAVAAQEIKGLRERPGADALRELGEAWRPWRAVAARILWHYYLNTRKRKSKDGM